MHLKSLTLRGFKSFASATTLRFEPGITCVVGPNGSGKSNVVDALSWVMGEQGAKSLRGGKMEDVIFAGTATRPPLGRAEVVLTIDNSDGALPIDYAEVTIARTMFRHGGSEYAVNGQAARLLDVQELLSDSGIGREMHVIVGQGQLDSILQATPEGRRGFIEEAAGVLKHRKRKEKALRKLEACDTNLNRLSDLLGEIRRQLKPLGRQAEVARRAAVIQAEVRDARARLLADELVQATSALDSDLADERATQERRQELETALEAARAAEVRAEDAVRTCGPELSVASELWFGLTALRERVAGTLSLAAERVRHGTAHIDAAPTGRDPEDLEREADSVAAAHRELSAEVAALAAALAVATAARVDRELAFRAAEDQLGRLRRAAADRREGLARLSGQLNGARTRADAAEAEIARLAAGQQDASSRAREAHRAFTALESRVAGLDAGELGLDAEHETAARLLDEVEVELAELQAEEVTAGQQRAALAARLEALLLGQQRKDAAGALVAETGRTPGVLGALAVLLDVQPSYEVAVAAALGAAADAVAVADRDAALAAFARLKAEDLGRAALLIGGAAEPTAALHPELPAGSRFAADVVQAPPPLAAAVRRALRGMVVVDDLAAAAALVAESPDLVAVTRGGDLLGAAYAAGGSAAQPSLIEVQAAVEETEQRLAAAVHTAERVRFAQAELEARHSEARRRVEVALAQLHESDAAMAAVAEELGQLSATARSAQAEADRLERSMSAAAEAREASRTHLAELEERWRLAQTDGAEAEPDPAERDQRAAEEQTARTAEIEARLALRTAEERLRAMAGRSEALRRAAQAERSARVAAETRRERLRREGETAAAVLAAGRRLQTQLERSLSLATAARTAAETTRQAAEADLQQARARVRALAAEFELLVDAAHRDELARAQQRLRVENLTERAMVELGLEATTLTRDFGPDQPVPVLTRADGTALEAEDGPVAPVPYVREDQQKRLRAAERALAVLGRVNPLALEEFDALQERHQFLAEQLEDLRRTRASLIEIIAEVDSRVEQVFAEAYADVEQAFGRVFSRLFPGGEGRLVLTEPGNWLTTGVEVEARPPGKKIKRLSLLSGGERSLVAVAFLVSLFLARPSPFYILDEVEAALDDTNLGRLLEIYAELRASSQLLVITHQKRTMEVADALYGVTMRGDGVSTVISSRLRDSSVA